jgi:DNA-binding NarL/FixJ family response regulator
MERVYVVEDSAAVRSRIVSMLNGVPGVDIVGASGAIRVASEAIRELAPDTVILDIRLEDGNGIDLLQMIKSGNSPTRVIMLTNFNIPAYEARCRELGADFFFDKSNDFEKILDVIKGDLN